MSFEEWAADAPPDLQDGHVHIWHFDLDVAPGRAIELEATLSHDELQRAGRFRFPVDRARFVAARGLLRSILASYSGIAPERLSFAYSQYGKPSLAGDLGTAGCYFNATGSDAAGMVAVRRDAEVGIDLERLRDFPEALAIAKRMFTAEEQDELAALSEADRTARFFEFWARKEAIVKSRARGVWQTFGAFAPVGRSFDAMHCVRIAYDGVESTEWVVPIAAPRPGFVGAMSTGAPIAAIRGFQLKQR